MDVRFLARVRDSQSWLCVEFCRVDQEAKAIALYNVSGKLPNPCAPLELLMLGP